jgi:hypothetical protein
MPDSLRSFRYVLREIILSSAIQTLIHCITQFNGEESYFNPPARHHMFESAKSVERKVYECNKPFHSIYLLSNPRSNIDRFLSTFALCMSGAH